jgi:hypothetical protein
MNIASCVTSVTPHDNFKNSLPLTVGTSIDLPRTNINPELLLSTRFLPNGNIEYRYRYLGDCVQKFEVNPKNKIIVRADFEGSETSCISPP